jgi:hypothetical protein
MRRLLAWTAGVLSCWIGWAFLRSGYWLMGDPGDNVYRDPKDPATGIRWMVIGAVLVLVPVLSLVWRQTRGWMRRSRSSGDA